MMRFDTHGIPDRKVMAELRSFHEQDMHYRDGRIMGSMCTSPEDIAKEAHSLFLEANLGNPGLCSGTAEIEKRVIGMLCDLLNLDTSLPHNVSAGGQMMSGGTEANITALWLARNLTKGKEVVFPESAHFSLFKAADILGLRTKIVPLDKNFRMDVERMKEVTGKDTAAIVAIAGTTELGQIDPIREIGEFAWNKGIFLHVDAAFGGFVLPFLDEVDEVFDFRVEGVSSIGVDPHKMGLSTIPAGALLLRDASTQHGIAVPSPYLTTGKNMTLSGTRNSASVAATYAVMRKLGREGYQRIIERCMENTQYLAGRLENLGLKPVIKPGINVLAVRCEKPQEMVQAMKKKGWQLSRATHPDSLRFVVMPHIERRHLDDMLSDLEIILNE